MPTPIRVAIANDYDVVVAGVAACLQPYHERVEVVELVAGEPVGSSCDVILYDTFGQAQGNGLDIGEVIGDCDPADVTARVLVFSWDDADDLVECALARGAAGYVSKRSTAAELVDAIERVHAGESVRKSTPEPDADALVESARWPGDEEGLTARESEVLALICQGLSNQEIAERAFLGINTVKTYVRGAYRKAGVASRSQAVIWGMAHGFAPGRSRVRLDDERQD